MTEVTLKLHVGDKTLEVTMDTLTEALGLTERPNTIKLCVRNEDATLEAGTSTEEQDYPGIDVDAVDENDEDIYLMSAELPNADVPGAVAARLYAGYSRTETDEPIALVRTPLKTEDELKAREDMSIQTRPLKNIYVDTRCAAVQVWTGMDGLTEYQDTKS